WLLLHTVTVGLLAGLVAALCRCRRLPPAAQHLLWLVVLAKLLTPPVLAWPWALPTPFAASSTHSEPPTATESEPRPEALEIVLAPPVAEPLPSSEPLFDAPPAEEPAPFRARPEREAAGTTKNAWSSHGVTALWLAGG